MDGILLVIAYHVEILNTRLSEPKWTHVHPPMWETNPDLMIAMGYAESVRREYPAGTRVRIVTTRNEYRLTASRTANIWELD